MSATHRLQRVVRFNHGSTIDRLRGKHGIENTKSDLKRTARSERKQGSLVSSNRCAKIFLSRSKHLALDAAIAAGKSRR
jgi:hypothetical protein